MLTVRESHSIGPNVQQKNFSIGLPTADQTTLADPPPEHDSESPYIGLLIPLV